MRHFVGAHIWDVTLAAPAIIDWAQQIDPSRGLHWADQRGMYALEWDDSCGAPPPQVERAGLALAALFGAARTRPDRAARPNIAHDVADTLARHQPIESALGDLDGEFLLMAWDDLSATSFLATDPTGHHSLYYASIPGGIVWSSHPLRVAKFLGPVRLDREAINLYFALEGVPAPWSMLQGVRKVQPGHVLLVQSSGICERAYWRLADQVAQPYTGTLDDASRELINVLTASIKRYAAGNSAAVGVFLSGGLDSTALLALGRQADIPLHAFTVGYSPAYHSDETEHARHAANALGVPIEVLYFSPHDAATLAQQVLPQLPEPAADPTLLPQMFLARHTAGQTQTVLDGTGADAVFAGTTKFTAEPYVRRYQQMPQLLRHGLIEPAARLLPASRRWRLTNYVRRWQFFASGCDLPFVERAVQWTRFASQETVARMLAPKWRMSQDLGTTYLDACRRQLPVDDITGICFMTLKGHTPWVDYLKLASLERESGLSVRTPFMSPGVVEFGLRLPGAFKVSGTVGKLVLRRACEQIIPAGTLQRRKAIFATPISQWLQQDMRELFWETLRHPTSLFDFEQLRYMARLNQLGWRDWQSELWAAFVLQRWWIANNV
jgi:asparagine synthase (glutamine-hydrolysing)